MEQKGLRNGHFLALVGLIVAIGSLWRPWYSIRIPQEMRDFLGGQGLGSDSGMLGQMLRDMAQRLPSSLAVSGWDVLDGPDVAIAVVAALVALAIVGASGGLGGVRVSPEIAARAASGAGAGLVVFAFYKLIRKPGEGPGADWIHVGDGLYLALLGGALTAIGGFWARAELSATARPAAAAAATTGPTPPSSTLNAEFPPLTPDLPPVFAESSASVAPPRA